MLVWLLLSESKQIIYLFHPFNSNWGEQSFQPEFISRAKKTGFHSVKVAKHFCYIYWLHLDELR